MDVDCAKITGMKSEIILIGSGAYGEFIQKALTGMPFKVKVLDGRSITARELLESEAEHVIIATPNYTHFELVSLALNAGKHVLCEKPLALTLEDVNQLYALAQEKNRYLGVGFVLTNHPFYWVVKKYQETHGPITRFNVLNNATEGMLEPDWYWDKTKSGGWFMVAEIHWYHLFAWLTQSEALKVNTASEEIKSGRTIATYCEVESPQEQQLIITHRLDESYDSATTSVDITFEDGYSLSIDDWVPRSMKPIPLEMKLDSTIFRQEKDKLVDLRTRNDIYKELIILNIEKLLEGKPGGHINPIIVAHQTALDAQKNSDEKLDKRTF